MCDCDFLPHYFIWSTEDTQQLYPNRLVELVCIQVCGGFSLKDNITGSSYICGQGSGTDEGGRKQRDKVENTGKSQRILTSSSWLNKSLLKS